MPYCDEKRAIFLHIPKTGGTLVKELFRIRRLDDPDPDNRPSPQHLTCEQLRERMGARKYDAYYKFTFVRNPWARLVSSYCWRQQLPRPRAVPPFPEFIALVARTVASREFGALEFGDHSVPQTEYTRDVDDVFRFEDIEAGIRTVARRLRVEIGHVAPREAKSRNRYWELYDTRSRELIAEAYADEIDRFGFSFGEP